MSEFTKGKWEKLYIKTSSGGYYKIISESVSVCNIITRNEDQAEANAKLISCAPEMLNELQNIVQCWDNDVFQELDIDYIRELIKKSTEL